MAYVTVNQIFATQQVEFYDQQIFLSLLFAVAVREIFLLTVKTKASEWKNIQNSLTAMSVMKRVIYTIFHHVKLEISFK